MKEWSMLNTRKTKNKDCTKHWAVYVMYLCSCPANFAVGQVIFGQAVQKSPENRADRTACAL